MGENIVFQRRKQNILNEKIQLFPIEYDVFCHRKEEIERHQYNLLSILMKQTLVLRDKKNALKLSHPSRSTVAELAVDETDEFHGGAETELLVAGAVDVLIEHVFQAVLFQVQA